MKSAHSSGVGTFFMSIKYLNVFLFLLKKNLNLLFGSSKNVNHYRINTLRYHKFSIENKTNVYEPNR